VSLPTWGYLAILVVSLAGLGLTDWRHRLAFRVNPKAAGITVAVGVAFFLLWDFAGIALGIFFRGDAPHLTGIMLAPELPLEELFFLTLLCYSTLIGYAIIERMVRKYSARYGGSA
jgi:lycopene cyclase domain-containing protein